MSNLKEYLPSKYQPEQALKQAPKQKKVTFFLIIVFFLLIGTLIALFVIKQRQDFKQIAYENFVCESSQIANCPNLGSSHCSTWYVLYTRCLTHDCWIPSNCGGQGGDRTCISSGEGADYCQATPKPSNTPRPQPTSTPTPPITNQDSNTNDNVVSTIELNTLATASSNISTNSANQATTSALTEEPNPIVTQVITTIDCNEDCNEDADCANISHICYEGSCRLDVNPADINCRLTDGNTIIERAVEIPTETGFSDWSDFLKIGVGVLGLGTLLLILF
jgi:hypothetical protein